MTPRKCSRLTVVAALVVWVLAIRVAQASASALQDALADTARVAAAGLTFADAAALDRFHAARGYAPLFVDEGGATARGQSLAHALDAADAEGLEPADYDLASLRDQATSADPAERASAELAATGVALRFARDLAGGRLVPRDVMRDAVIEPPDIDVEAWLTALAATDDVGEATASQLPARAQIAALRDVLARLRAEDATLPPWSEFTAGATLRPGDRDARMPALRRALIDRGDLLATAPAAADGAAGIVDGSASTLLYDPPLVDALRRFQARHGLSPDGVVGAETMAALEVSRARRIEQLAMNLERERWFAAEPRLHIDVNVPAFELEALDGSEVRLRTRVIVGTRKHPTPIFVDRIGWIELNPAWNVPRSIALAEYADDLRTNPERMAARGYELVPPDGGPAIDPRNVDWAVVGRDFPFRLRQRPGDQNALGQVKFVFPNALAIYLHDTPSRALFARPTRAFSHGCVRVQDPLALAALLLDRAGEWDETRLEEEIGTERRRRLMLPAPVSVRLVYRTAFVDTAGTLQMRADLYGRDARQLAAWSMARQGTGPVEPPAVPPSAIGP